MRIYSNSLFFSHNSVDYTREVSIWFNQLMPRMERYLYGNGGPIIMVQVENEYGLFSCDQKYKEWMRDEVLKYVGDKAVIFTNDYQYEDVAKCGKIDNVLATIDFGPGKKDIWRHDMKKVILFL